MSDAPFLYPQLLGAEWAPLAASVRRAHFAGESKRLHGTLILEAPNDRLARLWRRLLGLPRRGGPVATALEITADGDAELWDRRIGDWRFISYERASERELRETVGPLELTFELSREGESLRYRQTRVRVRLFGLALPIPPALRPRVEALESPDAKGRGTHLQVRLSISSTLLLAYHGDLEVE